MGHSGAGIAPLIPLDRNAATPLHKQIYESYRAAVLRGDLHPGQQIPSTRQFATEAGISRFPVLHAYTQLLAEGYFESRTGSGTFVSASLPEQVKSPNRRERAAPDSLSGPRPVARRALLYPEFEGGPQRRGWGAFGVHQPAFEQFPFPVWSRLVTRHSRNPQASVLHHINPLGLERFRQELCIYLRTSRAVQCDPEQIMIVSGSQQALDITARVLLDPGSRVLVEEPGYNLERVVLTAAGCSA
jgi:GntR family transcriptional regulator/MocR family aminotransferase